MLKKVQNDVFNLMGGLLLLSNACESFLREIPFHAEIYQQIHIILTHNSCHKQTITQSLLINGQLTPLQSMTSFYLQYTLTQFETISNATHTI